MSEAPHVDASLRELSYKERDGYPYIIHPLLDGVPRVAPELLEEFAEWAVGTMDLTDVTVILAPEAMGIPLAAALSLRMRRPYVVARKREYGLEGEQIAYCETGYGKSCIHINDVGPDDRVLIVDDVISTAGTLTAICATLRDMDVPIVGVIAAIAKGDGADVLQERARIPVHAMRRLRFQDDGFTVESP